MNVYEAVRSLVGEACPEATGGVHQVLFPFDNRSRVFISEHPAICYEFYKRTERMSGGGKTGFFDVVLEFDIFGKAEEIIPIAEKLSALWLGECGLEFDRFEFVLVQSDYRDLFEEALGNENRRIWIQYKGVIIEKME